MFSNPLVADDAVIYSEAANATSVQLDQAFPDSRSATVSSFDNIIYSESDPRLRQIKSQGNMGSVIDLVPPAPSQYDNLNPVQDGVSGAVSEPVRTPSAPARPNRPPRPTRPANF